MAGKNTKGTSTHLSGDGVEEITSNLRRLLADVIALYIKTKKLSLAHHWAALPRLSSAARRAGHLDRRDNGYNRRKGA